MDNKPEEYKSIEVACAVIIKDRKVLATQRGYGDYAGWWEFPGGKIEPGEDPETALVRELNEEIEADISVDRYFDTSEHDYPKFHATLYCYLCSMRDEDFTLLEHSSAMWLGRDDVGSVKWLGADIPIIEKLINKGVL